MIPMPSRLAALAVAVALTVATAPRTSVSASQAGTTGAAVDAAFQHFWSANRPAEVTSAAESIVKSGVGLSEAIARLKRGRPYAAAPTGVQALSNRIGDTDFGYVLDVPRDYDPARRYQVRIQLHGGVTGRTDGSVRGTAGIGQLAGAEQIYVLPVAWNDVPWWGSRQIDNLRGILESVKRRYNVDENRVVLSGVSDGGTAAYYVGMHDTTPYASFLPLNGAILVLSNESLAIDGDLLTNNLVNKPLFVVNGWRDQLYPPGLVEPYVEHLQRSGVDLTYKPQPQGAHNTAWWPEVRDSFEDFVRQHPRNPNPSRLSWESDLKATGRRAHWLIIDELNPKDTRAPLPDLNRFVPDPLAGFGLRAEGARVVSVLASSSASTFNLQPGDVVLAVNGQPVPAGQKLLDHLATAPANTFVTLKVQRGDTTQELRGYFAPGIASPRRLFNRSAPTGRVDLVREGNLVEATTRGVAAFTLLLSPDVFDFTKPIKIVVDGRTVVDAVINGRVETLMKWAAQDNDRTMLFAAEASVRVP